MVYIGQREPMPAPEPEQDMSTMTPDEVMDVLAADGDWCCFEGCEEHHR